MIYLHHLNKQFGRKVLFRDVNFHLRPNETVGLVGENGAGKTTLLRIITRKETADSGRVTLRQGARAALLEQELGEGDKSVLQRVVSGDPHFQSLGEAMKRLERDLNTRDAASESRVHRYGELQHEFERLGGYEREPRARAILSGLGFHQDQLQRPLGEFSGGWRMRAEMARLLLQNPDILLLDEPTNHFDLQAVLWLEAFLKNYDGSLLLISHDRRFLNGLAQRIVELDRGTLTPYSGNYDDYERQKQEREARLEAEATNQKRRIAEIERFVERFRAKNTKATQVQSRIRMLEKMDRVKTMTRTQTVHFRFPQPARSGRIAIELASVDKRYGEKFVYRDFSIHLERGWKVALVGQNGAGKSTLLKLLAGILGHEGGEIKPGHNVTRAYYAQHQSDALDPAQTVLESMEEVARDLTRTRVRTILGAFLFSGDDVDKKVAVLSGGERSRLSLARLLASPASLLLLDEPTNHLDMRSCEVLAAALADYEGTLCTISHDRYFLDGIINRVWEVDSGTVREYPGNYSDYEHAKAGEAEFAPAPPAADSGEAPSPSPLKQNQERKRREARDRNERYRILKPLKSRLEAIEHRLEEVLQEKSWAEQRLADPSFYGSTDKKQLMETLGRQKDLAAEEKQLMEEWDRLTTRIEQVEN